MATTCGIDENGNFFVRNCTPEEEAEILARDEAAAAAKRQFAELKLAQKNSGARRKAKIEHLEKLLEQQIESDDLSAIETNDRINQLKNEE